MPKAIPIPPEIRKITVDKAGKRCFPVVKTSKGLEYLIFDKNKLKLIETTNKRYKFLILE